MDYYYKKKTWKKKYEDREEENFKKFNKLDNEINAYKNKVENYLLRKCV